MILGAGGSARAVVYALAKSGVRRAFIANRTRSRAESLVRWLQRVIPAKAGIQQLDSPALSEKNVKFFPKSAPRMGASVKPGNDKKVSLGVLSLSESDLKRVLSQVDLLVNATKVGLSRKDALLIPSSAFPKKKILVYDLIYKPAQTKLLKTAHKLGHKIINGETMLLHQGAKAFEIWTGKTAPIREMRKALKDAVHSN